jgi:hypothetical protein
VAALILMVLAGAVVFIALGWDGVLGGLVGLLLAGAMSGGGRRADRRD